MLLDGFEFQTLWLVLYANYGKPLVVVCFCPGTCCSLDGHLHSGIASSSGGHQRHWRQKENVNLFPPPVFSPNWDGGQQLATADVEGSTGFFRSPFCRVGDPIPGSGWGRGREAGRQAERGRKNGTHFTGRFNRNGDWFRVNSGFEFLEVRGGAHAHAPPLYRPFLPVVPSEPPLPAGRQQKIEETKQTKISDWIFFLFNWQNEKKNALRNWESNFNSIKKNSKKWKSK